MTKRLYAAVLCAVLALVLLPVAAQAAGVTVSIVGVNLPAGMYFASNATAPQATAPASGGYAHLSGDGKTLSLNAFRMSDTAGKAIIQIEGGSLTLDLTGDSTLSASGSVMNCTAFKFNTGGTADRYTLTVQGAGTLQALAESFVAGALGITVQGNLRIKSGTVWGEVADANDTGTGVALTGSRGKLTIEGGTLYGKPINGRNCISGIICGSLDFSDGEISGNGKQCGIYATDGMRISGGIVTGGSQNYGIYSYDGTISISGGNVWGDGKYGVGCETINISSGTVLFTGTRQSTGSATRIDLSGCPVPPQITASTDYTGTPTTSYDPGNPSKYKYLKFVCAPLIAVTPSGSTSFAQGFAAGVAVFTLTSNDGKLNATDGFLSATLDGKPLDLGKVGAAGADGLVEDGSLVLIINRSRLNKLQTGRHTLRVSLQGDFAGRTAEGVITVVPKMGDGTPLLPLVLALLASLGGAAFLLARRRFARR